MSASRAWRGCRTGTCTTCAPRAPTAAGVACSPRPGPESWPSPSDASPAPTGSPDSCASIPSTRATATQRKGSTTSTPLTRSPSTSTSAVCQPSPSASSSRCSKPFTYPSADHIEHRQYYLRRPGLGIRRPRRDGQREYRACPPVTPALHIGAPAPPVHLASVPQHASHSHPSESLGTRPCPTQTGHRCCRIAFPISFVGLCCALRYGLFSAPKAPVRFARSSVPAAIPPSRP